MCNRGACLFGVDCDGAYFKVYPSESHVKAVYTTRIAAVFEVPRRGFKFPL